MVKAYSDEPTVTRASVDKRLAKTEALRAEGTGGEGSRTPVLKAIAPGLYMLS